MPKILSQAGTSLADVYDVEGSIAGVEQLDVESVKAVHDLGGQIHSERTLGVLERSSSGDLNQTTTFGKVIGTFPDAIARIFGVSVIVDTAARLGHCSIAVRDRSNDREMPIFVWDSTLDREQVITWSDDGGTVAEFIHCSVLVSQLPTMLMRMGTGRNMGEFVFRGESLTFGAGTVEAIALIHIGRPVLNEVATPGEPKSHGLPIPSW